MVVESTNETRSMLESTRAECDIGTGEETPRLMVLLQVKSEVA